MNGNIFDECFGVLELLFFMKLFFRKKFKSDKSLCKVLECKAQWLEETVM